MIISSSILLNIHRLSLFNSELFPEKLTKELIKALDLIACSFYILNHEQNKLILRAQNGFNYEEYESFELPLHTFPGRAIVERCIIDKNNLINSNEYRDKKLIQLYSLKSLIVIPFCKKVNGNLTSEYYGAVCLYPKTSEYSEMNGELKELQESISLSYTYSVDRTKMQVRERVVSAISKSNDLNSALYRILQSLEEQLSIEAGSLYLYEEKLKLLKLHATTGLESNLPKHDISFSKKDVNSNTWQSFINSEIISSTYNDQILAAEKFKEKTKSDKKSLLILPITRITQGNTPSRTKGVMRIVNKLLKHNGQSELISFTKEDVETLGYVSEIIGITSHMFLSKGNKVSYFEKIMHGTRSNISTSLQNLDSLERRGILNNIPEKDHFMLRDTFDWLGDIKHQMDRLENPNSFELDLKKISLTGDILMNSVRLFEKSAEANQIKFYQITNLQNEGFFQLPYVKADFRALMTVFRNLVENALKYRNYMKDECIVNLTHDSDNDFVYINFRDDGIGIPEEDKEEVFEEGFRSDNASRQDPAGTGLGLTQSKTIMVRMEGDLILKSCSPTILTVKIKKF